MVLVLAGSPLGDLRAADFDPATGLVIEPGYKLVTGHCTTCHSAHIIIQQGLKRGDWGELVEWMQEEQGLWEIPDKQLSVVLDYLALNYGPDRIYFPANNNLASPPTSLTP